MESTGETSATTITNTEPGIYRVNVSAFGKTKTGREFRLVVPEFTFNVEASDDFLAEGASVDGIISQVESEEALLAREEAERAEVLLMQQKVQEEEEQETLIIIAAGNTLIILVAVVMFYFLRRKKVNPKKTSTKKDKTK